MKFSIFVSLALYTFALTAIAAPIAESETTEVQGECRAIYVPDHRPDLALHMCLQSPGKTLQTL